MTPMTVTIATNAMSNARRFRATNRKHPDANRYALGAVPPERTRAAEWSAAFALQIVVRAVTWYVCCHVPASAAVRVLGRCNSPVDFGCSLVAENDFAPETRLEVVRVPLHFDSAAGFGCSPGAKTG